MLNLLVDLNDGCNLKCATCSPRAGLKDQRVIPLDLFERRVAPLFAHVSDFQLGCACEPLMLPYLGEALGLIARHMPPGRRGQIITNGTLLKEATARTILESGTVGKIRISVDGATAATFEAIRKGARFDKVMDNVAGLCALRSRGGFDVLVEINYTILRENHAELPRLVMLAGKLGVDSVTTHKFAPDDLLYVDADFKRAVELSLAQAEDAAALLGVVFQKPVYRSRSEFEAWQAGRDRCVAVKNTFRLDPTGTLMPQCHAAQLEGPLCNLLTDDLEALLASERFRRYCALMERPHPQQCGRCPYFGGA